MSFFMALEKVNSSSRPCLPQAAHKALLHSQQMTPKPNTGSTCCSSDFYLIFNATGYVDVPPNIQHLLGPSDLLVKLVLNWC